MKQFLLYAMILTVLIAVLALLTAYVSKRMAWSFDIRWKTLFYIIGGVFILFTVVMQTVMGANMTNVFSHLMNNVASIGLGVIVLLIFSVASVDLVNIVVKFSPSAFGFTVIGLTSVLSAYSLWNATNVKTYHKDILLQNLVEPIRIAQLSDIHLGHFWGRRSVEKLVDIVERENVDAVVITGDMFDGRVRLNSEVLEPFKRLSMPIYFIEGNHDTYSGTGDIKRLLSDNNIDVLDNKLAEVKGTQIIGLDYLIPDENVDVSLHPPHTNVTIKETLPRLGINKNVASILLHHNPIGVNYASDNGINLYLSGHTHAGQIFPATLIAHLIFEFNKGLYKYNETTQVYVSQGSGTFGPPMRLGTHSEVTILNLKKE